MTLDFVSVTVIQRKHIILHTFLGKKIPGILIRCGLVQRPVRLLKLVLNLFYTVNIQKDFSWIFSNIFLTAANVRALQNYFLFKWSLMKGKTELYSVVPVWVTLTFTRGLWAFELLVCKEAKKDKTFAMVDYIWLITAKMCEYGKSISFEQFALLLVVGFYFTSSFVWFVSFSLFLLLFCFSLSGCLFFVCLFLTNQVKDVL